MKNCLICNSNSDQIELMRIPVRIEGTPVGAMLVCRECMELLGLEEVQKLVMAAVREQSYEPTHFLSNDVV